MIGRHLLTQDAQDLLDEVERGDITRLHRLFAEDPIEDGAPILSHEEKRALTDKIEEMARARAQGAANGAGYFIGGH